GGAEGPGLRRPPQPLPRAAPGAALAGAAEPTPGREAQGLQPAGGGTPGRRGTASGGCSRCSGAGWGGLGRTPAGWCGWWPGGSRGGRASARCRPTPRRERTEVPNGDERTPLMALQPSKSKCLFVYYASASIPSSPRRASSPGSPQKRTLDAPAFSRSYFIRFRTGVLPSFSKRCKGNQCSSGTKLLLI